MRLIVGDMLSNDIGHIAECSNIVIHLLISLLNLSVLQIFYSRRQPTKYDDNRSSYLPTTEINTNQD